VKTTPIKQNLDSTLNKIILNCSKDYHNQKHHWECLPNKLDFEHWYTSNTLKQLVNLKYHIFKIHQNEIKDFFKICFSLTMRKSSLLGKHSQ